MAPKLYAIACSAVNQSSRGDIQNNQIHLLAVAVVADSEDAALAYGQRTCQQRFPAVDGFQSHNANICLVPDELIDMVSKPTE